MAVDFILAALGNVTVGMGGVDDSDGAIGINLFYQLPQDSKDKYLFF